MLRKIFSGKILMSMALVALISLSASAQKKAVKQTKETPAKGAATTKKKSRRHKVEPPQQNFQVCTTNSGYLICNETPGPGNTTHPGLVIKNDPPVDPAAGYGYWDHATVPAEKPEAVGPEQQSYPENIYTVIGVGKPYQNPRYIKTGPYGYKRP